MSAPTTSTAAGSGGPTGSGTRRALPGSAFLAAARGERPAQVPVWFMRQAGRSLPEYRRAREGTGMLESCLTPDLACEITMQPVRRYGVDAAILFSDIVVPLKAAGVGVDIVAGTGPVIDTPVRTDADVAALPRLDPERRRTRWPTRSGCSWPSSGPPRSSGSRGRRSRSPPTSSRAAPAATTSAPRRSCTPSPPPGTRCSTTSRTSR